LSLGNFSEAPRPRTSGKLFGVGGTSHEAETPGVDQNESRLLWPFTISFIGQGQLGGQYTLWADSYAKRTEWQEKLQHAKVLRTEVNDAGKVFEMTPLSLDTFLMPPNYAAPRSDGDSPFTGRVTCSTPFSESCPRTLQLTCTATVDGRSLVAVGCEEGVWIGLRHEPRSLRKVLHVKAVTNIAVLEEFGIVLVLQDKVGSRAAGRSCADTNRACSHTISKHSSPLAPLPRLALRHNGSVQERISTILPLVNCRVAL
jgi:hypothetical protein